MKRDKIYQKLKAKMGEVSQVKPQTLGPLTWPYRQVVPYFKIYPWRMFILASFFLGFSAYLFLGTAIVKLVSILQHGF